MITTKDVTQAINKTTLPPDSVCYSAGNAGTPQTLLEQIAMDTGIREIDLYGVLLLGERMDALFSEDACERITHRVIFNGPASRRAVNSGWAKYQIMHLSEIPRNMRHHIKPGVALISVAGPDNGGNFSLSTCVEGVYASVLSAKEQGGLVIAERNARNPFIVGTTIPARMIDYIVDTDRPIPLSPVKRPDERSLRIGEIINALYIRDGSTLQYGIGEVPEAVSDAIVRTGRRNLRIHTELFSDALRRLVENGSMTDENKQNNHAVATIFLSSTQEGYRWLDFNSSIWGMPSDYTNNLTVIAGQPKLVAVNAAIGCDLHGNIWADSFHARKIFSGIGGQADFLRAAQYSPEGKGIIAMKSTTDAGSSKITDMSPPGITATAIPADEITIVTEQGAVDSRELSLGERAVAIAHLASPEHREELLRRIYDSRQFHRPEDALKDGIPKGFIPYERI